MIGKHLKEDDRSRGSVDTEPRDVREHEVTDRAVAGDGLGEARRRFGGFDLLASLAGMLAALGLTVLLAGLAGAAGSVGYQRGANAEDLSTGGLVTGLAILLAAFFVGGWVAGRMARYDGLLNGLSSALLFVLLAAGISAAGTWLGDRYDFFTDVNLPQWFTGTDEATALGSAALGIVVMVAAAALGGAAGGRYHRRADAVITATAESAPVHENRAQARTIDLDRSERASEGTSEDMLERTSEGTSDGRRANATGSSAADTARSRNRSAP